MSNTNYWKNLVWISLDRKRFTIFFIGCLELSKDLPSHRNNGRAANQNIRFSLSNVAFKGISVPLINTKCLPSSCSRKICIPFSNAPQTAPNKLCPAPAPASTPVGEKERTSSAFYSLE
jgi:hypothetical protein